MLPPAPCAPSVISSSPCPLHGSRIRISGYRATKLTGHQFEKQHSTGGLLFRPLLLAPGRCPLWEFEQLVAHAATAAPITVHVRFRRLDAISSDGRLKNRFETGFSGGNSDVALRDG